MRTKRRRVQTCRGRSYTPPTLIAALFVAAGALLILFTATGEVGASAGTTTPNTHIKSSPSSPTKETAAAFRFASAGGATFRCSLDGGPFRPCESPKTYRGLTAGEHRFRVRAADAAGHADPTPASRSWTVVVESVAPTVTIEGAPRIESYHEYHYFRFSADVPGSDYFCSLDQEPFVPCTSGAYRYVPYGEHTYAVYAVGPDGVRGETAVVEYESRDPNWD